MVVSHNDVIENGLSTVLDPDSAPSNRCFVSTGDRQVLERGAVVEHTENAFATHCVHIKQSRCINHRRPVCQSNDLNICVDIQVTNRKRMNTSSKVNHICVSVGVGSPDRFAK